MEPEKQEMLPTNRGIQISSSEGDVIGTSYGGDESREQHQDPEKEYISQDLYPPHYPQHVDTAQGHQQQAFLGQYPPPGAGQISPNHPVPGSFPQKDVRMYHQQQPQYGPAVVYNPYTQSGTSPGHQTANAQLYPGYGTTQPMMMAPGPQPNMGSVTFVNPVISDEKDPKINDYLCLSIIACLCLFCPTGCIAIYFSTQTRDSIRDRNFVDAKEKSKKTLKMVKISFVIFLIGGVIALLWKFVFASLLLPSSTSSDYGHYNY